MCAISSVCCVISLCVYAAFLADGLSSGASKEEASKREEDCRAAEASGGSQPRDPTGNQGVQYALLKHCLAS